MARKKAEVVTAERIAREKMSEQLGRANDQIARLMYTISMMRQALRAVNQDEYGWDELTDATQEKVAEAMNMPSGIKDEGN